MVELDLSELEQQFRQTWRLYDPARYEDFLHRASEEKRPELLARMLAVELEYSYQPPIPSDENETTILTEDDERVKPSVQLFVLRFPDLSKNHEIIIRLSVLEYALRLRYDAIPPNADSYLSVCEQSQDRLLDLLHLTESKLPILRAKPSAPQPVCSNDSTVKETTASVSITLDPLPFNLGCFLLLRMVGKGGMGYVHSAIDLRSSAPVAVKVMRRVDPWSVYRFIEEFTWLSKLNHPNLVKLYDAFSEGDVRYFSMELVEGKTIRQWFERIKQRSENSLSQLRGVLAQAASAIHFLHEHGVIHCDIKCSNLMIASQSRAVLLDLGLAVREGHSQPLVGTLQYMAPEVLDSKAPSRASDWYSFGALMYEVITDELPPIHVNVSAEKTADRYQLNEEKILLGLSDTDQELSKLCLALLQQDPLARPQGDSVLRQLGVFHNTQRIEETYIDFEGRDPVIEQLNELAKTRPNTITVIRGESGIGKSTILQRWLAQQKDNDQLLVSIRCYRQDHTPLRLLNLLVQELLQVLKNVSQDIWLESLQVHVDELGETFPQIRQLVDEAFPPKLLPRSGDSARSVKHKGVAAVAEWLVKISQRRRLLIAIDDAQWADLDGLQFIAGVLSSEHFEGTIVVVDESDPSILNQIVGTELAKTRGPNHLEVWKTIDLEPLASDACIRLVERWASRCAIDLSPAVAVNLSQRSTGSPFLLQELFHAYLHYAKRDGISEEQWLNEDPQSSVRRRFSMLPIQSENVLQYLAIAGESIGFHQLQMVSRILPHELQRTLSLLASQGWVRSKSNNLESDIEIAHATFRATVLNSLSNARLHRRHFRMARMLSSEVPPPWEKMASHYWSAESLREAAACYLEAARKAFQTSSYKDALFYIERALHPAADRRPTEKLEVLRLKADCLTGLGNSVAAAEIYDELAQQNSDTNDNILYECFAGEQWIRAGQLDIGLTRLEDVLQQLGISNSKRNRFSKFRVRCRTLWAALFDRPPRTEVSHGQHVSALQQRLNGFAIPLTFLDNELGPDLILRLKKQIHDQGSDYDMSLAILNWSTLLSFAGRRWRKTTLAWLSVGKRLARKSKRPSARGAADFSMFIWHLQKGAMQQALQHAHRATAWFLQEPNKFQWEIQFLYWGSLGCYWYANQFQRLRSSTEQLRLSAIDRSDSMSLYMMNVAAAHQSDLVADNIDRAREAIEIASNAIANQTFQSPRFFLWLSRINQALYEGRPNDAIAKLQNDWGQLSKSYVFGTNHYRWLALCARMCCNLTCARDSIDRRKSMFDARRCLKQMAKLEEPAFIEYGRAFELLVETAEGKIPSLSRWEMVIQRLHKLNHHLYAYALQWHMSLYVSDEKRHKLQSEAESALRNEGCVAPEKLLDIILPLPVKHTTPS